KTPLTTLKKSILFQKIKLSQHQEEIKSSLPLMIQPPNSHQPIPLTYHQTATHLNFPPLTPKLFHNLHQPPLPIQYNHNLLHINKHKSPLSLLKLKHLQT
ncbi:malate:quinone oxidoreductase, partial [Staphylococcus aureus]|uniref:malate:quinone oxidoreductase n=1 Tax=Staphylococcus aureus TaxID=1280 RepID=UPI001642AC00